MFIYIINNKKFGIQVIQTYKHHDCLNTMQINNDK